MLYETSSFVKFAGVFKSIVAGPLFATVSKAGQPIFNFAEHPLTEVSSYFFVSASIAACEIASSISDLAPLQAIAPMVSPSI